MVPVKRTGALMLSCVSILMSLAIIAVLGEMLQVICGAPPPAVLTKVRGAPSMLTNGAEVLKRSCERRNGEGRLSCDEKEVVPPKIRLVERSEMGTIPPLQLIGLLQSPPPEPIQV